MNPKLAVVVLAALAAGEPRDDHGPKRAPVVLTFAAYSSNPSAVGIRADQPAIAVEAAWISIQSLRVHSVSGCRRSEATAIDGPITTELIASRVIGLADGVKLPVDAYCSLDIGLRRSREKVEGAPPDLRRASIVIVGKRADSVPFVLRSRLDTTSHLVSVDLEGFAVPDDGVALVVAADLARWMDGVDLTVADVDSAGNQRSIRIDANNNQELLARFEDNVSAGLGLFRDADGDRALGDDERRRPIATGSK